MSAFVNASEMVHAPIGMRYLVVAPVELFSWKGQGKQGVCSDDQKNNGNKNIFADIELDVDQDFILF